MDALGNPVRVFITSGTVHDATQACKRIEGIEADHLLAAKGYDSQEIVDFSVQNGINPVIPSRKNRKVQRNYDHFLYKERHLVENAFLKLKHWRGIATRYSKNAASFLAIVQIGCIFLWLK